MVCCIKLSYWLFIIANSCVIVCCIIDVIFNFTKEKEKKWSKFMQNDVPFIFILISMSIIIITSIIGFILSFLESKCLYKTYMIINIFTIFIEIVAIVFSFCYKAEIIDGIEENWINNKFNETRMEIESDYKCCGFKNEDLLFPCSYVPDVNSTELCYDKIKKEIDEYMICLQISSIMMTIFEIALLICTIYIGFCNKKKVNNI